LESFFFPLEQDQLGAKDYFQTELSEVGIYDDYNVTSDLTNKDEV